MGYKSEVGIVVTESADVKLRQSNYISGLLDSCNEKHEDKKCVMYFWNWTKWDGREIDEFELALYNLDENDFFFLRLGEEYGGMCKNPFGLTWTKEIYFNCRSKGNIDELNKTCLKQENSKPEVKFCSACGTKLTEPYPRIKYCPECEK